MLYIALINIVFNRSPTSSELIKKRADFKPLGWTNVCQKPAISATCGIKPLARYRPKPLFWACFLFGPTIAILVGQPSFIETDGPTNFLESNMKLLTLSQIATIILTAALILMMSLGSNLFAQTEGSGTRFPQLEDPASLDAALNGSLNRSQTVTPVFDALGNLVEFPDSETFGETLNQPNIDQQNFNQQNFRPVPESVGPRLPNQSPAERLYTEPPTQEYVTPENLDPRDQFSQDQFSQNQFAQPPAVVERARPLPPRENFYQSPNTFPPAGPTGRREYSRADIELALQRLAIMEQLLRQQLRREAALRYSNTPRYPGVSGYGYKARYPSRPSCGNGPTRGYSRSYGRPAGY